MADIRNKLIAKAFKEIGLIERYGSGIRRIINICSDYGLKQPMIIKRIGPARGGYWKVESQHE